MSGQGPTLARERWPALFPERPDGTLEEIQRRTGGLRFTESEDPRLHFTLVAPAGWRWRPTSEAGDPPGLLMSLVLGTPQVAEIAVFADNVPREVSPAEWALHRLERHGHTLWAKREERTPIGLMADLLTRREGPEGTFVARTNMAKDGKRIFTLVCQAREDDYPRWASDFYVALASFHLLDPERAPLAEALAPFCYLYPAVVGFSYPASWGIAEDRLTEAECDVRLRASPEPEAGIIHASARSEVRPRKMVADWLDALERQGVVVGERPTLSPCEVPTGFHEASSLIAAGEQRGRAVELQAVALTMEKATLLLGSCGPARSAEAFGWMVQARAFEIVRETAYAV